jgi:hemerythrin superfamily protein
MKATDLLKQQHRKVEAIFRKLEKGHGDEALVQELAANLTLYMAIEQEIFYPAVREMDEDVVGESFEEHAVAELALKRLLSTSPDEQAFKARVTTLKELIEHHVKEEEEELFPKVEKQLDEATLKSLGTQMKARFQEAVAGGPEALLPRRGLTTSADVAQQGTATRKARPSKKVAAARRAA